MYSVVVKVVMVVVGVVLGWRCVGGGGSRGEYRVVYHDLKKVGELTGEEVSFGFGYYMMTAKSSSRGIKIDPRLYTVSFERFD
jgi:hypothetical protein